MKIYKTGWFHHKNEKGLLLLGDVVQVWNGETDGIIISNEINEDIIQNPKYPHVIIGPGVDFLVALRYFSEYAGNKRIIFNCLSPWQKSLFQWYSANSQVQYECIPFPVDTEKFRPVSSQKKRRYFIYYKHRHSDHLNAMVSVLEQKGLENYASRFFIYGQYNEEEYLDYIREAEFGIWVGGHESQGFALEEALSCDCPLFVYDVKSLKDECMNDTQYPWGRLQGNYPATSASYFDDSCGMVEKEERDLSVAFNNFYGRLGSYKPREYVLNHLTTKQFHEKIQGLFPEKNVNINK